MIVDHYTPMGVFVSDDATPFLAGAARPVYAPNN